MRARPPAANAAMIVAALWLLLCGVLHAMTGIIVPPLFSVAPLIVATVADDRRTAIVAGAAAALAVGLCGGTVCSGMGPRRPGSRQPA